MAHKRFWGALAMGLVSVAISISAPPRAHERVAISREVFGAALGMNISQVAKVFKITEQEDRLVILARKYAGAEGAEKRAKLNRVLGKSRFVVEAPIPEHVDEMELLFRKGILYQIGLHYREKYVRSVDWDVFTLNAFKRYGAARAFNEAEQLASVSYQWTDARTRLEIEKSGTLSTDRKKFQAAVYNVFYTDIVTHASLIADEEHEERKEKERPRF